MKKILLIVTAVWMPVALGIFEPITFQPGTGGEHDDHISSPGQDLICTCYRKDTNQPFTKTCHLKATGGKTRKSRCEEHCKEWSHTYGITYQNMSYSTEQPEPGSFGEQNDNTSNCPRCSTGPFVVPTCQQLDCTCYKKDTNQPFTKTCRLAANNNKTRDQRCAEHCNTFAQLYGVAGHNTEYKMEPRPQKIVCNNREYTH